MSWQAVKLLSLKLIILDCSWSLQLLDTVERGKPYNCFYSFSEVSVNASDLYLIICVLVMIFFTVGTVGKHVFYHSKNNLENIWACILPADLVHWICLLFRDTHTRESFNFFIFILFFINLELSPVLFECKVCAHCLFWLLQSECKVYETA